MIQGVVNAALEAIVPITIRGPMGHTREVDAVIDTGFTDYLTLPPSLVAELGLAFDGVGRVFLADGTEARFGVHIATVLWDGERRDIYVYAADTTPLIGMRMLEDHDLSIQVRDGGRVVVEARR